MIGNQPRQSKNSITDMNQNSKSKANCCVNTNCSQYNKVLRQATTKSGPGLIKATKWIKPIVAMSPISSTQTLLTVLENHVRKRAFTFASRPLNKRKASLGSIEFRGAKRYLTNLSDNSLS